MANISTLYNRRKIVTLAFQPDINVNLIEKSQRMPAEMQSERDVYIPFSKSSAIGISELKGEKRTRGVRQEKIHTDISFLWGCVPDLAYKV